MNIIKASILLLSLLLFSCCGKPVRDAGDSPSALNQMRLVMKNGVGDKSVGVLTGVSNKFSFMTYGVGTYSIRGFGGCSGHTGGSFKNSRWVNISVPTITPLCMLQIEVRSNALDSNISGIVVLRSFDNPDVKPLKITTNGTELLGVNSLQLAEQNATKTFVNESTKVVISTEVDRGVLRSRSSCKGVKTGEYLVDTFDIVDGKVATDLNYLYRDAGGIDQSCLFEFLVNPDNSLKEGGTLYVHVYRKFGSWLETPLSYVESGDRCFEFTDPYVVGILVDGKASKLNQEKLCVDKKDRYEVMAITSKLRLFFGVFNESDDNWEIIK